MKYIIFATLMALAWSVSAVEVEPGFKVTDDRGVIYFCSSAENIPGRPVHIVRMECSVLMVSAPLVCIGNNNTLAIECQAE